MPLLCIILPYIFLYISYVRNSFLIIFIRIIVVLICVYGEPIIQAITCNTFTNMTATNGTYTYIIIRVHTWMLLLISDGILGFIAYLNKFTCTCLMLRALWEY